MNIIVRKSIIINEKCLPILLISLLNQKDTQKTKIICRQMVNFKKSRKILQFGCLIKFNVNVIEFPSY